MQTPDPVVTAARRAQELYDLHDCLEEERFELEKKLGTLDGDNEVKRDRFRLVEESGNHVWDEVETLRADMTPIDATSLPGAFAQVIRAWYLAKQVADKDCQQTIREMDRLFMSVVRYLSKETGIAPEEFGAESFFMQTAREIIKQGYKAA